MLIFSQLSQNDIHRVIRFTIKSRASSDTNVTLNPFDMVDIARLNGNKRLYMYTSNATRNN